MGAKTIAALVLVAAGASAETPPPAELRVTAVRHWSLDGVTRIAVQVTGDFEYHSERLHNPERVFFDIANARPSFGGKRALHEEVGDALVTMVRIAETVPEVTRVVVDLAAPVAFTASKISNPSRLMIELRPARAEGAPPVPELAPAPVPGGQPAEFAAPRETAPARAPAPAAAAPRETASARALAPAAAAPRETASARALAPAAAAPRETAPARALAPAAAAPRETATAKAPEEGAASLPTAAETGTAAKRKSDGRNSLIRALGLKINRVVIDPGHGGHDQGTVGRRGLMEKELVLDIARRLGDLMQQQIGCEVIYTRTDDTFVPLERRTTLANEQKADLFISLHANSSSYTRIAGVETFYLNFTTERGALDVAARENASSQKAISELQDLLQKIARQEKIEESKELATRIQSALFSFSSRYNPGIRNRGVKKAPFVVLLGAQMPSVLVEIGFLSNSREETLLKRPDHRQRVAEALLRGITRYTQGLSHFQMAQAQE